MIVKIKNEETFSLYECDYTKYGTLPLIDRNGQDYDPTLFPSIYSELDFDIKTYGFSVGIFNAAVNWVGQKILSQYECYSVHDNVKRKGEVEAYSYIILFDDNSPRPEIVIYNGEGYVMNNDGKTIQNISDYRYDWKD